MTKGKFNYYEHQQRKQRKPWIRGNNSRVAVNPERITTLFELAVEHYGRRCARCGSKKRLTVHHRHYRTVGFEQPGKDIVLLCHDCHKGLHDRGSKKQLSREDIPYVDPRWAEWLEKEAVRAAEQLSWYENITEWLILYKDRDGLYWVDYLYRHAYAAVEYTAQDAVTKSDGQVTLEEIIALGTRSLDEIVLEEEDREFPDDQRSVWDHPSLVRYK